MAKRKRLVVGPAHGEPVVDRLSAPPAAPVMVPAARAPIADVVGQSAESAALARLADEMTRARTEGRMMIELPLDAVDAHHLTRDRVALDEGEMEVLKKSLLTRGQQTPIEVVDLEEDSGAQARYGLISGYRRLTALRALQAAGQWDGMVNALVRQPADSGAAYTAMVEENEIRVGLSYFERARIVLQAVGQGVFRDEKTALQTLFQSVSRSKRSKIKSFLPVVHELGAVLKFPLAISERQGLALAAQMAQEDGFAPRLADRLRKADAASEDQEQALLQKALGASIAPPAPPAPAAPQTKAAGRPAAPAPFRTEIQGVAVSFREGDLRLNGAAVTKEMLQKVLQVLSQG